MTRPAPGRRNTAVVPRLPLWVAVSCAAGVVALLGAVLVGAEVLDKQLLVFLVEPASIGSNLWYSGVVSTTGALLWWSAATVCFVTAWVARASGRGYAGFWLGMAALSTVFTFDDLYQGHEYVIKTFLHLPETVTATVYGLALVVLVVAYRSYVRTLPWRIGLVALAFFAVSEAIDFRNEQDELWAVMLFLEEATKFAGIAAWALFFVWASQSVLLPPRVTAFPRSDGATGPTENHGDAGRMI
jgi:hypothetical protein